MPTDEELLDAILKHPAVRDLLSYHRREAEKESGVLTDEELEIEDLRMELAERAQRLLSVSPEMGETAALKAARRQLDSGTDGELLIAAFGAELMDLGLDDDS